MLIHSLSSLTMVQDGFAISANLTTKLRHTITINWIRARAIELTIMTELSFGVAQSTSLLQANTWIDLLCHRLSYSYWTCPSRLSILAISHKRHLQSRASLRKVLCLAVKELALLSLHMIRISITSTWEARSNNLKWWLFQIWPKTTYPSLMTFWSTCTTLMK